MRLYDYRTGEDLGTPSDEQLGEPEGSPFLVYWDTSSALHGRVLDNSDMPVGFTKARQVVVFDNSVYMDVFNGRRVWHRVS